MLTLLTRAAITVAVLTALLCTVPRAAAQRVSLVWDGDSNDDYDEDTGVGFRGISPDVSTRRDLMERLGFATRVDNPNNSQAWWDQYGVTTLFDVVYVTGEAAEDALADKLRGYQKPILCENVELDDNLGFSTVAGTSTTGTQITIDSNGHPVTATSPLGPLGVYTANHPIGHLAGSPAASLVALASESGQTVLGAIDVGGALANTISSNSNAVTRLVRLPFAEGGAWTEVQEAPVAELLEQSVLWATAGSYLPTASQGVCVMVTEQNGVLHEQELWRSRRLVYMGWAVIYLWDGDSQTNYDTAVAAANVVYVPATADASEVGDKLRTAACGVVYESNELDDNLGLATGGGVVSDNPGVIISDRGHPITGNFYVGDYRECFERFRYENNDWPGINQPLGRMTGTLAPDLDVLATRWSDPVLAAIDAGGELANNVSGNTSAAGRRVRLPWVSDTLDIRYLRSWNDGSQLWELALDWASGPNPGDLVAHYQLDEASGSTAADSSANGYDAEYRGGVTQNITPAPRSAAANFDATGEYVYAAPNSDFQNLGANNGDFSVAMWFRPGELTHNEWRNLFHIGGADSNDRGPLIMVHPTNRRPYVWVSNTVNNSGGYCNLELNQDEWAHLAVVKQGLYVRWYIDGVFINAIRLPGDSVATAGHLRIGEESWWGTPDGDLDDVRVYNYPLDDQEITTLYETLVLHYKFDETSATVAEDSSVFENDGTYTGSPTVGVDGAIGDAAVEFDGATSYLRVPAATQLDMTETLTIAAWINVDDFDNADGIFSRGDDGEQAYGLRLRASRHLEWRSNHSMNTPGTSPVGQRFESTAQVPTGEWTHVAAAWDGSNLRFYINGLLDSTHALTGTVGITTEDSAIGSDIVDADEWFDGRMDDLRVYNRALSDTELFELGGSGLRLHLKLDETSGTVAEDSSPFGRDTSVASGAPAWDEGVVNNGAVFNGIDDVFATDEPFDPPATGAVAFWMKRSGRPATTDRLFGTGGDWEVRQVADGTIAFDLGFSQYTGTTDMQTLEPVGDDERWHHVVANYDTDNDTYSIYLDGELHRSETLPYDMVAQPAGILSIGDRTGAGEPYTGQLDDVRVYAKTLNAEEVADLYGLVGHWRLDEIAGDTVARDETVFAHDADYLRTPVLEQESPYPSQAVRTAARFDPGDYLRIPHADHLELGKDDADFSVAYWLRNNRESSGQWRETVKKHFDGRRRTFSMWLHPTDERLHPRISTKHSWNEGMSSIARFDVGVWRHVAYVKRGSQLRLYVDGVLDSTDNLLGEVVSNNGDIYFGVRSTGWRSDVTIDDIRLYSRALNDWEVAELHGLVGWYRMEDMSGTAVTDSSGFKNHGVVLGGNPGWPLDAQEGSASIELNGANYIQTPDLPLDGPGAAVSGWAKLVSPDSGGSEVVSLGDSLSIRLDSPTTGTRAFGYNGWGWDFTAPGRSFENAGWRHFAASYRSDLRELSFFIDGVQVDATTLSNDLDLTLGSAITIGTHGTLKPTYNYTGQIDDVKVYNRPISRAEARGLFYGQQVPGLRIVRWVEVPNP